MKIMKRIASMLLAICLIVPCFSMVTKAAEGVIFFTDLETKVGDTFDITGTVVSKGGTLKDVSVQMSYDTSYMRFVSGDGVNADSEGKLTYTGTGSSDRLEFTMTFQALQEGSSRMTQEAATVTTTSGETLSCTNGYSDVTIGAGDPSKIVDTGNTSEVTIDGQSYTLSEAFSDNEIPAGFTTGDITYEGTTYKGAVQANSDIALAYLIDSNQAGKFWVYNSTDGTFSPCDELLISDEYSIIVLNGRNEVKMPDKYEEVSMEINGTSYPVWTEPDRDGFYILYAVNNEGEKSLYLYDSLEHTYQRMETPKAVSSEKKTASNLWGKMSEVITNYLVWFVVGVVCLLLILVIFLIVFAVKLHHRNVELDDLYDEYGIDDEQDSQSLPKGTNRNHARASYEDDEDDFDDYYEDDEYYDDDDNEDDLSELRRDFMSELDRKKTYDEYYDDDDFEEGYEDERPRKSSKSKDDTFTMDFIDLD
ncbi:hypothetical protein NE683_13015 [Bariatricus massiliensis]|uniref:Cohesin domain-containing protein n=1 Tax=Bariatricus massiliensis TaxID=1745713 RepID=A0ABS8DIT3_9FIRM|nr:hypothetical protein [Bariatricus massiliensis]MCB7305197.1 hypothetical protein [Bariatricus massiliensis]MCB7375695.1 hypothetical protein [Bariatricus massiliensis]MCB7388340.1 hypothetical protein [Bariatricus massiliensis]MCB7412457.1 hypothetical protein [Bariatricus massiliensis]MCQ5254149.1 hypothetical protein [Bariatricus massiliensis]